MRALNGMGFVCDLCQACGGTGDVLPDNWFTLSWPPEFHKEPCHVCFCCAQSITKAMILSNWPEEKSKQQ